MRFITLLLLLLLPPATLEAAAADPGLDRGLSTPISISTSARPTSPRSARSPASRRASWTHAPGLLRADVRLPHQGARAADARGVPTYLRNDLKIADPPAFGIYLGQAKAFVTFVSSGLGTFAHEIMHPLVERNLPKRPPWADKGIPSFFEKFLGYWDGDRLVLRFGYQNPWRIETLGDQIDRLDLRAILHRKTNDYGTSRNSDLRMVSVFLWRTGKLPALPRPGAPWRQARPRDLLRGGIRPAAEEHRACLA